MIYYRLFSRIYEIGAKRMGQDCRDFIKMGSKILDLGCGSGIAAKHFQNCFQAEIMGVDIKDNRVVDIPFKIFDGKHLPFANNSFDVVLISYVLHHSPFPEKLLEEAKRVGKKIIIFEDLPEGILSKLRCSIHQLIFFGGERKFNFKKSQEWKKIFQKLRLKIIIQKPVFTNFSFFDPVKKILFILEPNS